MISEVFVRDGNVVNALLVASFCFSVDACVNIIVPLVTSSVSDIVDESADDSFRFWVVLAG